jgi:hypothetical protein
MYYKFEF